MKQLKPRTIPTLYLYISSAVALATVGLALWYFFPLIKPTQSILSRIGTHVLLPRENPTIATISDKTKLATQAFFSEAQNGDVLLVYKDHRKAILYRPTIDKILNISTITLNSSVPTSQPSAKSETPIDLSRIPVTLLNGTSIVGYAAQVQRQLLKLNPTIRVASRASTKGDYAENFVTDLSGAHAKEASYLAKQLHAKLAPFPDTEKKPTTPIVVIIGDEHTFQ